MTVIDGMAVVHAMGKSPWVKTCSQWADHFTAALDSKCSDYDEVHLVFDRYDLPTSLKEAMRERDARVVSQPLLIMLQTTHQSARCQQSSKQFLSSNTTKDELTVYLAKKALRHF